LTKDRILLVINLTIIFISIVGISPNVWGKFFIETEKNAFYPPYAFVQYGPDPSDSIGMFFLSVNNTTINQTSEIFNPHVRIDDYLNATGVTYNTTLQPSFDTFFSYNRLQEPVIPHISNISMEIAPILNSLVRHVSQLDIGSFVPLVENSKPSYLPSFTFPSHFTPGFSLLKLNVNYTDHPITAHYVNTVYLYPNDYTINSTFTDPIIANDLSDSFENQTGGLFADENISLFNDSLN
jgi:hypothetical protein